jgi:hypothetical protein
MHTMTTTQTSISAIRTQWSPPVSPSQPPKPDGTRDHRVPRRYPFDHASTSLDRD